ncbi:MAG: hypothetical protein IJB48_05755 [Clostridia bacterium]|nr:hypothetical protein [Clostridia bacterium]
MNTIKEFLGNEIYDAIYQVAQKSIDALDAGATCRETTQKGCEEIVAILTK